MMVSIGAGDVGVPYFAHVGVLATWRETNPFESGGPRKDAKTQSLAKANQGTTRDVICDTVGLLDT
jgi:hypothetical protein